MRKPVHLIKQIDAKDCGAACLSMILQYYGKKISLAEIAEKIKVDQFGASIYGMIDGAKQFDLIGVGMEGATDEFISEVKSRKIQLPVVARILNRFQFEHYVVITGIYGKRIYYNDPGEGRKSMSIDAFSHCFLGQIIVYEKGEDFIRENRRKGALSEFARLIGHQKKLVATIGILSLFVTGIGMAGTFLFQYLIDQVIPGINNSQISDHTISENIEIFAIFVLAVGILYLLRFAIQFLRGKLLILMTKRINLPLMLGYYDHVVDLKMNFFGDHKTGDILSRFNDAGKIQEALSSVTLTLMIDVVMVLFCGIILYRQSKLLFFVVFLILVLYVIISALYIHPLDKKNRQLMQEGSLLNSYLKESVDGIQTVKACNAGDEVKTHTKELFSNFQNHSAKTSLLSMSKDVCIELMTSMGTLCLLWVGAISIVSGSMTLGTLMTFYTLLSYFLSPIQNVLELQPTLQAAIVAIGRLRDILDRSKEIESNNCDSSPFRNGDISIENVNFRYGNRALVLNDLSMKISQGDHVALVGASGCGKTTITKLLMGFYKPELGQIKIGENFLHNMNLTDIRKNIAYVSQETFLFSDTIRKNLLLGNNQAPSDIDIEKIITACGCNFVFDLPFGLDTMLEENGSNLSGGQRQRLSIARAILRFPKILVLDEATSNLDALSEREILDNLHNINPEMTVIMVAHRLNSIRNCDQIFVLDKGHVAESGSHKELIEQNSLYASMCHTIN